jgi:hypothetical protein
LLHDWVVVWKKAVPSRRPTDIAKRHLDPRNARKSSGGFKIGRQVVRLEGSWIRI